MNRGEFESLRPFGATLTRSLKAARWDPETTRGVWEEEDYCLPPLSQERDAVLDRYFENIHAERVSEGEGWRRISDLPSLWEKKGKE